MTASKSRAPYVSRELLLGIKAKRGEPKMTKEEQAMNENLVSLLTYAVNELCFVVHAQLFPLHNRRKSHSLLEKEVQFMKMLKNRHLISANVFHEDQKYFTTLLKDYENEVVAEYKNLYNFISQVEENNAYEGFRVIFGLEDIEDEEKSDQELREEHFIKRKYQWINSGQESCFNNALTFYNSWNYVKDYHKKKIQSRYGTTPSHS